MLIANPLHFEANCRVLADYRLSTATMEPTAVPEPDQRSHGRSNVFLTAVLDSGSTREPVRIRNLSHSGALVEASNLPPVGAGVCLIRGNLTARGTLAWADSGNGGISFAAPIDVAAWVKRVGHGGQQRVDGLVAALRSSAPVPDNLQSGGSLDSLAEISVAIDQVCENVATRGSLSVELGEELLKLDAIAAALRRIAKRKSA